MDTLNKRKVDIWEDDWEKEANFDLRKREPPNKTASYIGVLEQHHEDLSQTCNNLESTLASLTTKLNGLQSTLLEEQTKLQDKQQQRRLRLAKSLEIVTKNYMQNQNGCLGTLHENQQDLERILFQQQVLSATFNQLETHYISSLSSLDRNKPKNVAMNGNTHDDGDKRLQIASRMGKLIAAHNKLEERYINAKVKNEAYQAGTRVLEKEINKINGLPRFVPILRTTTEEYQKEIEHQLQCQDKLPISEMIKHLGDLRIRFPLLSSIQSNQNRHLYQTASRLKKVYQGLLRQRSNQQTLTYSYEVEMQHLQSYKHALLAYRTDILNSQTQETISSKNPDDGMEQQEIDLMARVKQNLSTFQHKLQHSNHHHHHHKELLLDPNIDYTQISDEQVIKSIKNLVTYETRWNKRWSEDINDNLDGVQLLDQAKQDLTTTLFGASVSRKTLETKPKAYDDLQWTLETLIGDMKKEADQLKNESQVYDQVFQDRRRLISLFFTDPFTFESKMDDHLDSLDPRNSVFDSLY